MIQSNKLISGLLFFVSLFVYIFTLYPSVPGGDSGSLIVNAYFLGVQHPPGYPLFTLLAHLFTFIPFGSIAWRVNLFSAVCSSLAVVLLFMCAKRITKKTVPSLFAAALLAFSPLYWQYSLVAEVFSLNNVICLTLLYLAIRFDEEKCDRFFYLGAFVFGLGVSHHHTVFFVAFPILIWIFFQKKELLHPRSLATALGFFSLGLLPYLLLPISSAHPTPGSWGDTSSLRGFLNHFFRREYGTFQLAASNHGVNFFRGFWEFVISMPKQTLFFFAPLAAFGILTTWVKNEKSNIIRLTVFIALFYLVVFHSLANTNYDDIYIMEQVHLRFFILPSLFVFLWIAVSLSQIQNKIPIFSRFLPLIAFVLIALQLGFNFKANDNRENHLVENFARFILDSLPPNATLLSIGDLYNNTIKYVQFVEGYRKDVRHIDFELLKAPWGTKITKQLEPKAMIPGDFLEVTRGEYFEKRKGNKFKFLDLLYQNLKLTRTYLPLGKFETGQDETLKDMYYLTPNGFTREVIGKTRPIHVSEVLSMPRIENMPFPAPPKYKDLRKGSWEEAITNDYWRAQEYWATFAADMALNNNASKKELVQVANEIETLFQKHPHVPSYMRKNVGLIYYKLSQDDPKFIPPMARHWKLYVTHTQENDPQLKAIERVLASIKEKKPEKPRN